MTQVQNIESKRIYSGCCENYLNDACSYYHAGELVNLPERDFYPYGKKEQDNAKIGKCFNALWIIDESQYVGTNQDAQSNVANQGR
ncbi:hypothetical protein MGWOODY_Clf1946 [hydrothermal vent metagenome]|uniref:Uncharacterized protein n=1 Tax=hydrothermal vent metagenome TaxID=652676 RepID=A0A170QAU8_9ZZZZ